MKRKLGLAPEDTSLYNSQKPRSKRQSKIAAMVDEAVKNNISEIIGDVSEEMSLPTANADQEFIPNFDDNARQTRNAHTDDSHASNTEERILDELLIGLPPNDNFYLKLYKVVPGSGNELKCRVDQWHTWSDMEYEVFKIVRDGTQKNPQKWGSGTYRIVIWRDGGLRGTKFPPRDFNIDAGEAMIGQTTAQSPRDLASASMPTDTIAMIKAMREANPTLSPAEMQGMIANAQKQGMDLALEKRKSETSSENNTMTLMMGLITALIGTMNKPAPSIDTTKMLADTMSMMKTMGAFEKPEPVQMPKQPTLVEQLKDLRALGLIPEMQGASSTSPLNEISKVKEILGVVSELSALTNGSPAEKQTMLEKVIDMLAPKLPEIASRVLHTIDRASEASALRSQAEIANANPSQPMLPNLDPNSSRAFTPRAPDLAATVASDELHAKNVRNVSTASEATSNQSSSDTTSLGGALDMKEVNKLASVLHDLITSNNQDAFPEILEVLDTEFKQYDITSKLKSGIYSPKLLVSYIDVFAPDARYKTPQFKTQAEQYLTSFVSWLRQNAQPIVASPAAPLITPPTTTPASTAARTSLDDDDNDDDDDDINYPFNTVCDMCHLVLGFPSEAEYMSTDDKTCGEPIMSGDIIIGYCAGMLRPEHTTSAPDLTITQALRTTEADAT